MNKQIIVNCKFYYFKLDINELLKYTPIAPKRASKVQSTSISESIFELNTTLKKSPTLHIVSNYFAEDLIVK